MKLYLYGRQDGLSVTTLPIEKEGQITIYHPDESGLKERLLDIEGNGSNWIVYSTPNGTLQFEGIRQDEVTLSGGMLFSVATANKAYIILCHTEDKDENKVRYFSFPKTGHLTIGSNGCDINISIPAGIQVKAEIVRKSNGFEVNPADQFTEVYVNYQLIENKNINNGDAVDFLGVRLLFINEMIVAYPHSASVRYSPTLHPFTFIRQIDLEDKPYNKHLLNDTEVYFNRSPRVALPRDKIELSVEAPPPSQAKEEMPLIFSVGSSAFMSISSVMMAMNSISNAQAIGAPLTSVLPTVFMAGGMLVGSMMMPVLTRKYTEKKIKQNEEQRQTKYLAYLEKTNKEIIKRGEDQKNLLIETYPAPSKLYEEALSLDSSLWSYMPFHHDFLYLRLGTASLSPDMDVKYPAHSINMDEDTLQTAVRQMESNQYTMEKVPLILSLKETGIFGVMGETKTRMDYLKGLLIQLCTHHSYREMKLVMIYDKSDEKEWEFARWLPHVWNDNGEFRAIGTDRDAMRNISAYIDAICPNDERLSRQSDAMCVVVLADSHLSEQCYALSERMKQIDNTNMRVIAVAGEPNDLPKECRSVVVLEGTKGVLNKNIESIDKPVLFDIDPVPTDNMRSFVSALCNTHLNDAQGDSKLVDMITLFDMLRCGNVTQINAPERWKNSNPIKTLAAPVGIDKYGALLSLDIHQNAHGPHGLIAGMTGSGKSEFIITYLLSLAINYSPLEVGFILIDYKGGGMSDTLAALPHVVGVIDNLGGSQGIHRALVSIKSEIVRRQMVFKEISEKKHVSNMDIYKYQAMYRNHEIDTPMQHLILVSDEFAELKEQESNFMDDIVSMARIGRSLGIHLILATQKPTGVVSPQIASNARFHICLKVQDKSDSMEILGRPDAALLTKTGRFYMQVGFNEVFSLGQSAWSGAVSLPKDRYVEEPDTTFEVLNDIGEPFLRARPVGNNHVVGHTKQVDVVVKYLRETAEALHLMPEKSWKPALKSEILLDDIDERYSPVYEKYRIDPVIGVVDDPKRQNQFPLQLNLTEKGNAIVYGFTGAGKTELVNAVLYSLCKHHDAEELNIYCLDFASEFSRAFSAMPQVGDVMVSGEDEKINNFVIMLSKEMETRRKKLSAFGGNIDVYRKEFGSEMPNILVIVENYIAFTELFDNLDDAMFRLIREGNRFGIYFIITSISSTGLRYRLTQNFKQVLCLQMTDKMDYNNLVGKTEGTEPQERLGSGIVNIDGVLEFQTGFVFPIDTQDSYQRIQGISNEKAASWKGKKAPRVPILPEHVGIHDVCELPSAIQMDAVPIGIDKDTMLPCIRNFKERYITPVLFNLLPDFPYFQLLGDAIAKNPERSVIMLDAGNLLEHPKNPGYKLCDSIAACEDMITQLYKMNVERHNETKATQNEGKPHPVYPETVIMIADLKGLFDRLKDNAPVSTQLDAILKMGRCDLGMYMVLLQECRFVSSMSMHIWYDGLPERDGIWLGDGIHMQSILKTDIIRRDASINEQFGYVVQRGKARMIKLIEER